MPVRRKAASLLLRALVLLLALVAGCGAPSTEARTLPPLTALPVPSAAAAADATPAGAVAFVRHYFAEITRAFATKDPTLVSALSAPGCVVCDRYIATLTKLRNNNERTTPVTFTFRFAEAPTSDGKTARVDVQFDVPASTRYDAAGRVIYREKASLRVNETVKLARAASGWRVVEIT